MSATFVWMGRKTRILYPSIKLRHINLLQTKKINLIAYNLASKSSYTNKIVSSSEEPTKSPSQLRHSPNRQRCCLKPLEMLPKSAKESATESTHSKEPLNVQAA